MVLEPTKIATYVRTLEPRGDTFIYWPCVLVTIVYDYWIILTRSSLPTGLAGLGGTKARDAKLDFKIFSASYSSSESSCLDGLTTVLAKADLSRVEGG